MLGESYNLEIEFLHKSFLFPGLIFLHHYVCHCQAFVGSALHCTIACLGGGLFQPNGHGTNIFNYLAQLGLSAALNTCINVITTMIVK